MRSKLLIGLKWGVLIALVYSLYLLVLVIIRGPTLLDKQGTTLVRLLSVYWATGTIGGLLVGALWPLGRHLLGAMMLGYLVAALFFFALGVADTPLSRWRRYDVVKVLVLAAVLGPAAGVIARRQVSSL